MKKIISLLLALMLCASLTITVCAADTEAEENFIYDYADLLASYDETLLNLKLSEIS